MPLNRPTGFQRNPAVLHYLGANSQGKHFGDKESSVSPECWLLLAGPQTTVSLWGRASVSLFGAGVCHCLLALKYFLPFFLGAGESGKSTIVKQMK